MIRSFEPLPHLFTHQLDLPDSLPQLSHSTDSLDLLSLLTHWTQSYEQLNHLSHPLTWLSYTLDSFNLVTHLNHSPTWLVQLGFWSFDLLDSQTRFTLLAYLTNPLDSFIHYTHFDSFTYSLDSVTRLTSSHTGLPHWSYLTHSTHKLTWLIRLTRKLDKLAHSLTLYSLI